MNIQQLEYISSVNRKRNFVRAAEACFVTQPTLSMMIKRLEEELEVEIFDRKKNPVEPTDIGKEIILRAERIIQEINSLKETALDIRSGIAGEIKLGIIPTVAPYIVPRFYKLLKTKYPDLKLKVFEFTTSVLVAKLKDGELNLGIAAGPLNENGLSELQLYTEEFLVYTTDEAKLLRKKQIAAEDLGLARLWLLEDGHCLRQQVINLCEISKNYDNPDELRYETGSITTLIKMVDTNGGTTIIPQLAAADLSPDQQKNIRLFSQPVPSREISLISTNHYPRKKMLAALGEEIRRCVQDVLKAREKLLIIPPHRNKEN